MPTYDYECPVCVRVFGLIVPVAERDEQRCECGAQLERKLSAPPFKFAGRVVRGGGPDRFTADMLGVRLEDLPAGLKTP